MTKKKEQDDTNFLANLMMDTLKEHGRDYDNSKTEIIDFFMTLAGAGRPQANFPFKRNERIKYRHRIRDKDGNLTDKVKWLAGKVDRFGTLGYENRPQYIDLQLDNGTSRHLEYYQAMDYIEIGKLKRETEEK